MLITILADASHCPETKVGGYGYWLASKRGKKGGGGTFKGTVETSSLAEMMAVANALHIALTDHIVQMDDQVLIQIDCEAAIQAFGYQRKLTPAEVKTVEYVQKLKKSFNLALEFRHVKAHTSNNDNRSLANKACDKFARKAMRKAREQLHIDGLKAILKGSKYASQNH